MPEYKDIMFIEKVEGRDKPNYHKVGMLMVKDDGKMSIKMNTVPVGGWNGWLAVFDRKKKNDNEGTEPF